MPQFLVQFPSVPGISRYVPRVPRFTWRNSDHVPKYGSGRTANPTRLPPATPPTCSVCSAGKWECPTLRERGCPGARTLFVKREGPFVTLDVQGYNLKFLIDTGSDLSVIATDDLDRITGQKHEYRFVNAGALDFGNNPLQTMGRFVLPVTFGKRTSLEEMFAMQPEEIGPFSGVLSRHAVAHLGIIIDIEQNLAWQSDHPLVVDLQTGDANQLPPSLVAPAPNHSPQWIRPASRIKVPAGGDVLTAGNIVGTQSPPLAVVQESPNGRCAVIPTMVIPQEGQVPVRLYNPSQKRITIRPGQKIARMVLAVKFPPTEIWDNTFPPMTPEIKEAIQQIQNGLPFHNLV